jgi:hypothetical protein
VGKRNRHCSYTNPSDCGIGGLFAHLHNMPSAQSFLPLGRVVVTLRAVKALSFATIENRLKRHARGDSGSDRASRDNALSIKQHYRVFSNYRSTDGTRFCILTEADRSQTTVMLEDD